MLKFLKVLSIIFLSMLIVVAVLFFTYLTLTKNAVLDESKLSGSGQSVIIYDNYDNEVTSASLDARSKNVEVKNLKPDTINAFIASEDRTFFQHKGLNYKRMLKALYTNIVSRSFKEGASTISQQLVKNTHLSNDKTIRRKLNEIRLTRQLEKYYTKDEILEMYLNTIYFGHNCYGLQSAAEFYFNKKAEDLNLPESAAIVGLLTSPNNYSPFKNPEKCLTRRNIVLKSMLECGYIDKNEYADAVNSSLNAIRSDQENKYGDYISAIFDELEEINVDYYTLCNGCIIKTYLEPELQNYIEILEYPCDNSVIVTNHVSGGVKAYTSSIRGAKRQPGSTVKPIFVYAPAIEEKLISPFTVITDEKINYNGYSPENYDKSYHGAVTVTDSIKQSYNIPAVKTLNALTLARCEKYLAAMNIQLDEDEKNLSLALGGLKYGLTIKEIADRYSIFPLGGNYRPSRFIKEIITKDGEVLYRGNSTPNHVFSEGTCSLINDMLLKTTQSGTAKKLKSFTFDVASKTGTCGNTDGNTDAYTVSYTGEDCIAVWLGDKDNNRSEITGGKDCCVVMKQILEELYRNHTPQDLDTQSGTVTVNIDREEYNENNAVMLADPACPKLNLYSVKVLTNNVPIQKSDKFSNPRISTPKIAVNEGRVNIELCQTKYYSYLINRIKNDEIKTIYQGKWQQYITDQPDEGYYTYTVTPYFENENKKYYGEEIILPSVNLTKKNDDAQLKIPEIIEKNWFEM